MTTVEALDELLQQAGVDLGRPERRRDRAVRLTNEGMTEPDLAELVAWGHRTRRKVHTVGHWLGWVTSAQARWQAVLADMRKLLSTAKAQSETVNAPTTKPPSEAEVERRKSGMAYCRVVGDRVPRDQVAEELGVSLERLATMIDAEAKARDVELTKDDKIKPPPKPAKVAAPMRLVTDGDETW